VTAVRLSAFPVAALLALLLATLGPREADATVILSPVAVLVNTLGQESNCCDIGAIFDQSGLSLGFTSGVTDFDNYLALDPRHSPWFQDQEFFGPVGALSGTIVLDLGASFLVDRLALWNENTTGIAEMMVSTSDDVDFLLGVTHHDTFFPTPNTPLEDYPVEVFALSAAHDRYVRIEFTCNENEWSNCGIGEIAFSVPEPASVFLFGLGLAGLAARRRHHPAA
jgi:hypothetical protein